MKFDFPKGGAGLFSRLETAARCQYHAFNKSAGYTKISIWGCAEVWVKSLHSQKPNFFSTGRVYEWGGVRKSNPQLPMRTACDAERLCSERTSSSFKFVCVVGPRPLAANPLKHLFPLALLLDEDGRQPEGKYFF